MSRALASAGLAKSAGERDILSRRLGLLTRVVVNQHDGRGRPDDGRLEDLAAVDQARGQTPERDQVDPDDLVLAVEEKDPKCFPVQVRHQGRHQPRHVCGLAHDLLGYRDAALPHQGDAVLGDAVAPNLLVIGRGNVGALHYRLCSFLPLGGRA